MQDSGAFAARQYGHATGERIVFDELPQSGDHFVEAEKRRRMWSKFFERVRLQ
jgi:hypothetical protein